MKQKEQQILLAILCTLGAGLCSTLMIFLVKIGLERGESIPSILFWRAFWGSLILVPIITLYKSPRSVFWEKVKTKRLGLLLFRALLGMTAVSLFYYCSSVLSIAIASLLYFTIPLFMPLVSYAWKREKLPRLSWIGILTGFVGVMFVIQPSPSFFQPATLIGLASGFLGAISQYSSHLLSKTEGTRTITFYYFLTMGVVGFLFTLADPVNNWVLMTGFDFFIYLAIGLFGYGYLSFVTVALKHGAPSLVTSFLYSSVLFAMILDRLVWGTVMNLLSLIGMILVIAGVLLKLYFHKKHA